MQKMAYQSLASDNFSHGIKTVRDSWSLWVAASKNTKTGELNTHFEFSNLWKVSLESSKQSLFFQEEGGQTFLIKMQF